MRRDGVKTRYPGVYRVETGVYRICLKRIDPRTGKPKRMEKLLHGVESAGEAATKREELRRRLLQQGYIRPTRQRLADYAESWMTGKVAEVKASTRCHYAHTIDVYVLPILGDLYVDQITRTDILAWRDKQKGKPVSINSRFRVLRTLINDMVAEFELPTNPVERIRSLRVPPRLDDHESNVLSADELALVLTKIAELTPQWLPFFTTLALTGMRFGEATALKFDDVDEVNGVIHIRRSQYRGKVDTTKTGSSRTVPLTEELAHVLRTHRRDLVARQAKGLDSGWVFPSEVGEPLLPGAGPRKPLKRALKAAKISRRFTIHGFRRTFNNLMRQITTGDVVRSMTGHVTEAMTAHYSHIGLGEKHLAAAKLGQLLRSSPKSMDESMDAADLDGSDLTSTTTKTKDPHTLRA